MGDVFLVFPNYCLGRGLMDIAFNHYKNEFYFKTGKTPYFGRYIDFQVGVLIKNKRFGYYLQLCQIICL